MNHNSSTPKNFAGTTLFRDRNLKGAAFPLKTSAPFVCEPEAEGLELCLRGLLVGCLFVGLTICGLRLENFANGRDVAPSVSDTQTAVAATHPVTLHANEIL